MFYTAVKSNFQNVIYNLSSNEQYEDNSVKFMTFFFVKTLYIIDFTQELNVIFKHVFLNLSAYGDNTLRFMT